MEDLQAAERDLAEARLAARRAAVSLGRLERLAGDIRGERLASHPSLTDLSAFTSQEQDRLARVCDACAQAAPALKEAARSITALCREGEPVITTQAYRLAFEGAQATAMEVEAPLTSALGSLRADLAAGALPPAAWPIHDWLTRILQGLTVGLLQTSPSSQKFFG